MFDILPLGGGVLRYNSSGDVQSPFGGVGFWVGNFAVTFLE